MKTDLLDLRCADCMELMAEYPDGHFDLAITDPPYFDGPNKLGFYGAQMGKLGVRRGGYEKLGTWEVPGEAYFAELRRVSKAQIVWGVNYYPIRNLGVGRIVWDKCNQASTYSDCEIAYCSMIESVRLYCYMWNGMMQGSPSDGRVMLGNKAKNEKRIHATQKPVQLYRWLLANFAAKGQLVLDTHLGSASIAIAAYEAGVHLTGCEKDPKIYAPAMERVERETRQTILI